MSIEQEQDIYVQLLNRGECIFLVKKAHHPNHYQQSMMVNFDRVSHIINEQQHQQSILRELDRHNRSQVCQGLLYRMILLVPSRQQAYDLIKGLGFECMKQLLEEFHALLNNEFHCINPSFYAAITFVLGYILNDQTENAYNCLLVALRNVSIYDEELYYRYAEPLLGCLESFLAKVLKFPELSALIFIKMVQMLNCDIFLEPRKQNAKIICSLIETIWEQHKLHCIGFGRELYFMITFPLERFQNNETQWLSRLKRDLEEHVSPNNPLYKSLSQNENLESQKYRINYLIGLSPSDERRIKYMLCQQNNRRAVQHQLQLILEKNKQSFWFYVTLTRYIVCLLDFEESDSKGIRIGEFILCLHEETQHVPQLHAYFKKALFFDWLFQMKDQDQHNIQAGIYFLTLLYHMKQFTLIQEYLYFLTQLCKYHSPLHRDEMIQSVKCSLQGWTDFHTLTTKSVLPEQFLEQLMPFVEQQYELEASEDSGTLYEKGILAMEQEAPITFGQMATQPEYQQVPFIYYEMLDDNLESQFVFPEEAEQGKGEILIYKQLWNLTQSFLQDLFNNPNDTAALHKFIDFIEKRQPSGEIFEIVKEELTKIYYTLYQQHFDDIALRERWNIIQTIVDVVAQLQMTNSLHWLVVQRLMQIDQRTQLIVLNLCSLPNQKEQSQAFCVNLLKDQKELHNVLFKLYVTIEQNQFENIVENILRSKNQMMLAQDADIWEALLKLFTQHEQGKLRRIIETAKDHLIDKVLTELIRRCLNYSARLSTNCFGLIETQFKKLELQARVGITIASFEKVITHVNSNAAIDYSHFWPRYFELIKQTFIYQLDTMDLQQRITNLIPLVIEIRNMNKPQLVRAVERELHASLTDQARLQNLTATLRQWSSQPKLNSLMENIVKSPLYGEAQLQL